MAEGAHRMELTSVELKGGVIEWRLKCFDCTQTWSSLKGRQGMLTQETVKRGHEKVTETLAEIRRRNGG